MGDDGSAATVIRIGFGFVLQAIGLHLWLICFTETYIWLFEVTVIYREEHKCNCNVQGLVDATAMSKWTGCPPVRSISWENFDGFWQNFAYALILTTSSLGLLSIHFHQFVAELRPLNDVRISSCVWRNKFWPNFAYMHWYWQHLAWDCLVLIFVNSVQSYGPWMTSIKYRVMAIEWRQSFVFHSVSWAWIDGFWPTFAHTLILTASSLGLWSVHFRDSLQSYGLEWRQNFVSAQYLVNEGMDFDQILHIHWYWRHLAWYC